VGDAGLGILTQLLTISGDGRRSSFARAGLLALEDNRLYTDFVRFEWDPPKAVANVRTHGVSFAEAVTVLEDAFALTRVDPDAADETRWVTLGPAAGGTCSLWCTRTVEPTSSA
jgi:uncharacterized DUF497 family protein